MTPSCMQSELFKTGVTTAAAERQWLLRRKEVARDSSFWRLAISETVGCHGENENIF